MFATHQLKRCRVRKISDTVGRVQTGAGSTDPPIISKEPLNYCHFEQSEKYNYLIYKDISLRSE